MSSPNLFSILRGCFFLYVNILNYTSVSSDYFPASAGSSSFNSSENSKDNMIPPVFSSFYNNPCLKDVQAFYAKESTILSQTIISPAIWTPSPMPPKRTSTFETPAITLAAIRQLVADSVATALKAQAANMAYTDNYINNEHRDTAETSNSRKDINNHQRKSLHCQVSKLQQGGSSDQEVQKQRTSYGKQPAISVCNLSCLWRERALQSQCSQKQTTVTSHRYSKSLCDESSSLPKKEIGW
ncbi:hypothetical protein Tco_1131621 [Tanacetum coccineum]|uniref:Uncharacterized protein n=1 Tax=Tanacetum coccineum TaxID=301880 RepID=A0ABQ4XTM2_9ASTR